MTQTTQQAQTVDAGGVDQNRAFLRNFGAGSALSLIKILIQLILLPIMAHLLGPKEFGVYALAVPIVAFLALIADGGVGLSLAKDRTDSPAVWSTAFWILMITGGILAIIINLIGLFMARASGEPQLQTVMAILSLSFPFVTASVLPAARLIRSGDLVSYTISDFVATVVSAICAVVLGYLGFGAISLACQYAAGPIIRAIILNIISFKKPTLVFRPAAIKSHLSSGGILMSGRVGDLLCRSAENFIFGNVFGSAALGAYNFATQIPRFAFEAFSNPSWSALYAQSISNNRDKTVNIFYKVSRFMAFITFPVAGVLIAISPQIMTEVLGAKWGQAGEFLQILAPGYALSATASLGTAILLALNANKTFLFISVGVSVARVGAASSGYILSAWDSTLLISATNMLYAIALWMSVRFTAGISLMRLAKEMRVSFLGSVLCGLIAYYAIANLGHSLLALCLVTAVVAILYMVISLIFDKKNLYAEIELIRKSLGRR